LYRLEESEFFGHPDEFRERLGRHFAHDLSAVDANGNLGDAQFTGGLLVEKTRRYIG
jgi:hypothetical protein